MTETQWTSILHLNEGDVVGAELDAVKYRINGRKKMTDFFTANQRFGFFNMVTLGC